MAELEREEGIYISAKKSGERDRNPKILGSELGSTLFDDQQLQGERAQELPVSNGERIGFQQSIGAECHFWLIDMIVEKLRRY